MEVNNNKRYVAGAGALTTGIVGTVLGGAAVANQGGGLFGLLGGGNRLTEAETRVAKLEAERYTDGAVLAAEKRAAAQDVAIANLSARIDAAELHAEIDRKQSKIDLLEAVNPLAGAVASLQQIVGGITKFGIPSSAIIGAASN